MSDDRLPRCHSSGQSCPGESGPFARRSVRRAGEWDLTSRDNSVWKEMTAWDFLSSVTIAEK